MKTTKVKDYTQKVMIFIGGILIATLFSSFLSKILETSEFIIYFLLILFILFAMISQGWLYQKINENLFNGIKVKVFHQSTKNSWSGEPIFEGLTEALKSANESFRIIALCKPHDLPETPSRIKYYNLMEEILELKNKKNKDFLFERIIQVEDIRGNYLEKNQTDSLGYLHCKHLLELKGKPGSIKIRAKMIPSSSTPLSFAIIDESKILFIFPTIKKEASLLKTYKQIGTVLYFDDSDGKLSKDMLELWEDIKENSTEIIEVK